MLDAPGWTHTAPLLFAIDLPHDTTSEEDYAAGWFTVTYPRGAQIKVRLSIELLGAERRYAVATFSRNGGEVTLRNNDATLGWYKAVVDLLQVPDGAKIQAIKFLRDQMNGLLAVKASGRFEFEVEL